LLTLRKPASTLGFAYFRPFRQSANLYLDEMQFERVSFGRICRSSWNGVQWILKQTSRALDLHSKKKTSFGF